GARLRCGGGPLRRDEPVLLRALRERAETGVRRPGALAEGLARLRARPHRADRVRRPALGGPGPGAARVRGRARRGARAPGAERSDPRVVRARLLPRSLHARRALRSLRAPARPCARRAGRPAAGTWARDAAAARPPPGGVD